MNIEVQVRRKKVKNITLRISSEGEVTVTAPYTITEVYLNEFLKSKETWIIKKIFEMEEKKKLIIENNKKNKNDVLFLGKRYKIITRQSKKQYIEIENDNIIFNIKDNEYIDNKEYILENWYKEKSKIILLNIIDKYSKVLGEPVNRVAIKKMKTRWGSCNHMKRYINLNLELIKQPIEFIEYVVLHELAHLVHPNHSNEFWVYVEKYMSDYKERKALIKY